MQETREMKVWPLGWEDPLEEEMATHSSILAWKIPWTEEPGGLQSTGWQELDMTNVMSACAAEARLCWNWDCYCRLRLWEQRVLLQNALFHPLSSTPELVRGASLGCINILLNVFPSLFQVWTPKQVLQWCCVGRTEPALKCLQMVHLPASPLLRNTTSIFPTAHYLMPD